MKTLNELINEHIKLPNIKNDLIELRKKYTGKQHEYELKYPVLIESSFDKFVELNNIILIDDKVYNYYLNENFNNDNMRSYVLYQHQLYESIVNSYSAEELFNKIKKLSPNINISNVNYVNNQKVTQFSFDVDKKDDLNNIFTEQIIQLLHAYNYYVKERTYDDENSKFRIYIEPYKPKDITNYVYNDLNGILYHITLIDTYKRKILNKELLPKWKGLKYNDQFRDGRIFFIGNTNKNKIKHQLKSIKNTSVQLKNNQCIVLKIDLTKYKNKIRFRIDSSASGYNSYFTEEPIPDFCITPIDLDTWNYINKKELS